MLEQTLADPAFLRGKEVGGQEVVNRRKSKRRCTEA